MESETLLFPVGPIEIGGELLVGILIDRPRQKSESVWSYDWDSVFEKAIDFIGTDYWKTVKRMDGVVSIAEGCGRDLRIDHVIRLARLVGDLYDHDGFAYLTDDMNAYALMKGMAEFFSAARELPDGESRPVVIDIKDDDDRSMFVAAIGRDSDTASIYITQTPEMLAKILETSLGSPLPDWVGFVMAQVEPGEGWVSDATMDLFGVSFQPKIRTRTTDGETLPIFEERVQFLIVSLFRAADIARGAAKANGQVSLHNWSPEVEMWNFDLELEIANKKT